MPGLLSKQQRPQGQARGNGERPQPERQPRPRPEGGGRERAQERGQGGPPDGRQKPPPEMQEQYDKFVGQAYNLIYDDKTLPRVLERLNAGNNPVENLASTTVMAVRRVKESAEKNDVPIDNRVMMHGGAEISQDLANLAEKAGIHEYSEKEIKQASYLALDMYAAQSKKNGTFDEQAAQRDRQMLARAEQAGQIDKVLPGAKQVIEDGRNAEPGARQQKEKR